MNEINNVLDMGTGSGILAIFFAKYFKPKFQPNAKIFASDILQEAITLAKKNARKNNVENDIIFIRSNLFESFPAALRNSFDVILFNPPYLASEPSISEENREKIDTSWNGGKWGIELFDSFLIQAEKFLVKEGRVYTYFTASSKSRLDELYSDIKSLGYEIEILKKIHVFFEDIFLHKITKG